MDYDAENRRNNRRDPSRATFCLRQRLLPRLWLLWLGLAVWAAALIAEWLTDKPAPAWGKSKLYDYLYSSVLFGFASLLIILLNRTVQAIYNSLRWGSERNRGREHSGDSTRSH